jgi:hypothetical protein
MGIDLSQLLQAVIAPTLTYLMLDSPAAEQLVLGTAIQESNAGTYLIQIRGPAVSPWQLEPATVADLYARVPERFAEKLAAFAMPSVSALAQLPGNLYLACALCRLRYYVDPAPLPDAGDAPALAAYYKRVYNTVLGAATIEEVTKSMTSAVQAYDTYKQAIIT